MTNGMVCPLCGSQGHGFFESVEDGGHSGAGVPVVCWMRRAVEP
jgi:hypothetical protein